MATIALSMISNDVDAVESKIKAYGKYFDEICITIADKDKNTYYEAQKRLGDINLTYFKWVNNFAKARNYNMEQIKSDYFFWIDSDDNINNPEYLRTAVSEMEKEGLDAYYMSYIYGYNEVKEPIAVHWRERLIRKAHPFTWKGAVHETLISADIPKLAKTDNISVIHDYKSQDDIMKSVLRNHEIMENEVENGDEDPRTLYYLGRSYFMLERFRESAQTLMIYLQQSGWDEQKYDAWMKVGDALLMMDEYDKSMNANLEAIKLNPANPDGYIKMGDLYLALEQPGKAIEWLKIGMSKPPVESMEIIDPTLYTYRPLVSMAMAYFSMAKVTEAKKCIDKAAEYEPRSKLFKNVYEAVTQAYIDETTLRQARILANVVDKAGNLKEFMMGLPSSIRNDLRMRQYLVKAFPPKKWPDKTIVIFCGEHMEDWGPDTLDKGMGGSEEAVVYLSRELAKLGWDITVYNQRVEEYDEEGVHYKPWESFNPEDEFDVFIAWRNPFAIKRLNIKARKSVIDWHDYEKIPPSLLEPVDTVFIKSKFQQQDMADDKVTIVPNGLIPEQFDVDVERNPHKIIFGSSPDRGLDVLVRDILPKVKEEVPDVELVWAYGWNSFDAINKGDTEMGKWKWQLKRDMHKAGVKELGRISHEELAKEFKSSGVWAYPTSFPEIDCITAKKAQAAGCDVVTSGYAALQDSVLKEEEEVVDIHKKPEEIEKFTKRLIEVLKNPISEEERQTIAKKITDKYNWAAIAKEWDNGLSQS